MQNDHQLGLDFEAQPGQTFRPQTGLETRPRTVAERFAAFHDSNPHVYLAIVAIARELKRQGWQQAGMKMIFERLRWKYAVKTRGEKWNFNNSYTAYYARLVMQRETDLAGFFETREKKTD